MLFGFDHQKKTPQFRVIADSFVAFSRAARSDPLIPLRIESEACVNASNAAGVVEDDEAVGFDDNYAARFKDGAGFRRGKEIRELPFP